MDHEEFCALQAQTGLSNRALAEAAGIDERMVRSWRTGRASVSEWAAGWLTTLAAKLAPSTAELERIETAMRVVEAQRVELIRATPPPQKRYWDAASGMTSEPLTAPVTCSDAQ
jgi:hypothetical protein